MLGCFFVLCFMTIIIHKCCSTVPDQGAMRMFRKDRLPEITQHIPRTIASVQQILLILSKIKSNLLLRLLNALDLTT